MHSLSTSQDNLCDSRTVCIIRMQYPPPPEWCGSTFTCWQILFSLFPSQLGKTLLYITAKQKWWLWCVHWAHHKIALGIQEPPDVILEAIPSPTWMVWIDFHTQTIFFLFSLFPPQLGKTPLHIAAKHMCPWAYQQMIPLSLYTVFTRLIEPICVYEEPENKRVPSLLW